MIMNILTTEEHVRIVKTDCRNGDSRVNTFSAYGMITFNIIEGKIEGKNIKFKMF